MLEGWAPCLDLTCSFSLRARYLKHTIWLPYGSCLVFLSVRTIAMEWELRLKELQPVLTTTKEETSFQGSGWVQSQLFWGGGSGEMRAHTCTYIHMCVFLLFIIIFLKHRKIRKWIPIALMELLELEVWGLAWFLPQLVVCVYQVDGMDVLGVREAVKFAAEHCRAGKVSC